MLVDKELVLRPIKEEDMYRLWELMHKEEKPEFKKWDAPYYPHEVLTFEQYMDKYESLIDSERFWLIEIDGVIKGTVSYYWEHKPSLWLEMGIIFYEPVAWGKGYGTRVIRMWMKHLFETMPLVRVGFTTWSGNKRIIRVGEKLGMTMEARIRKVRYYNGEYYDSIRMGILREEWERFSSN